VQLSEKGRERLLKLAVVAGSVLLFVAGLELSLRAVAAVQDDSPSNMQICEVGTPNTTDVLQRAPGIDWDRYTHNADGFRDVHDRGNRSVPVLGDSHTYGHLVEDNGTFTNLLDRRLPDVSFQNYGVPGWGTAQQLLLYRDLAQQEDHDLVIVNVYLGNDMRDNLEETKRLSDRPYFAMENGSLIQTDEPERRRGAISPGPVEDVQRFFRENTETYPFLVPRLKALLDGGGGSEPARNGSGGGPPYSETQVQRQLDVTRALMEAFARDTGENDTPLLVAALPTRGEVRPGSTPTEHREELERYWERQRTMLEGVSQDFEHVDLLDLAPILETHEEQGNRTYGVRDGHIDEFGHWVTARTLEQQPAVRNVTEDPPTGQAPWMDASENRTSCPA